MTEKTATVTKPLFATVGAGDAIYTAVNEVVADVRERVATTDVQARVDEARERIANVPADVQAQFDTIRERIAGLPSELPEDLAELREKFTPEELRKLAEQYYRQALDIYADLAVRGEETVDRLRANQAVDEQIGRVESLYKDASARAEDALAKVTDLLGRGKAEAEAVADEVAAVVDAEVVAVTTEEPAPAPAAKAPAAKKAPAKKAPAKKAAPKKA
ncbi:heparin-binding hemagglutinin [Nocardia sp. MH4]|jgi:heparin binding hemagglutinin HbhA|uniref:heparin-binding hemagglutinin n=1 Tax=Nocardia TaxID=1817 RepID=UPI00272E1AFB|nr:MULTISPECIES: heparin-binding hemagglutinin [Nocardia]MBW0275609.1 heparin-binding hemagglutinin [Nocardia sp. MH4]